MRCSMSKLAGTTWSGETGHADWPATGHPDWVATTAGLHTHTNTHTHAVTRPTGEAFVSGDTMAEHILVGGCLCEFLALLEIIAGGNDVVGGDRLPIRRACRLVWR